MRNIEHCFFCATPFQIISAISILHELDADADIYILGFFHNAAICADILNKKKIFASVRFVEIDNYVPKGRCQFVIWGKLLIDYLKASRIAQRILVPNTKYNKVYVSSRNIVPRILWLYLVRNGLATQLIHFDDGAGSYFSDEQMTIKPIDSFLRRLIFGKSASQTITHDFLFAPRLYHKLHRDIEREILRIPAILTRKDTIELLNDIFQFDNSKFIKERVVILGCITHELFDDRCSKTLNSLYTMIEKTLGTSNIIMKAHPRDMEIQKSSVRYYPDNNMPFECICMNMNCNNKILVTVSSTAVCTPKLLLDQEPYVILFYKLVKSKITDFIDEDRYYRACRSLYRDPSRFMIPETMTELIANLNKLTHLN